MTTREEWDEEDEVIAEIIREGRFMNAKQGLEIGHWIAQGLATGLSSGGNPTSIVEKARKYDEIVRLWNAELAEDPGDIEYGIGWSSALIEIKGVIADDLTMVIGGDNE